MQRRGSVIVAAGVLAVITVSQTWLAPPPLGSGGAVAPAPLGAPVDAEIVETPLSPGRCSDGFVAHSLAHTTRASDAPARLFDSNGSGVAADDLDGDGLLDIVLGNLEGPNTILWNEGGWQFTAVEMRDRGTRTVNLVDVDADGRLDIVTTHRGAGIAAFRNLGDRRFEQFPLVGVSAPAYSMAWGDLDGDGDLDLASGSYDAELDQVLRSTFLFGDGAGVYVYRRDGATGPFIAERLVEESQALATSLLDLDLDGSLDLVVGNDFAMHDRIWSNDGHGNLSVAEPFVRISAHTMSIDAGDIDNDGVDEIFATDMQPATTDTATLAKWLPLMTTMDALDDPSDTQRIRNVLQVNRGDGTYDEVAERAGIDAAGWAWSGRFGDLDNDGDLDLYIVNGMIAAETFPYLDGAEIVEPNMTFANRGDGSFAAADWGLGSRQSGRGSVIADLDRDGRLDIVVNNLDSPAVAFENQLCGGKAIEIGLRQPGTANVDAIGATISLFTDNGRQTRSIRSGGGYLSGSPTGAHFGMADDTTVHAAEIRWPDGSTTTIDRPEPDHRYEVSRS